MSYNKYPKNVNELLDTNIVAPVIGDILRWNGTDWINLPHDHIPVAKIIVTSKISNLMIVRGVNSSTTLVGDTLTYAWSVTPAVGVTIFSPTAFTTIIQFPSGVGGYRITLTVTNSVGQTNVEFLDVTIDRTLYVGGSDSENSHNTTFTDLQSAFNWINLNDVGNASNYTIFINSLTTDTVRIVPNTAKVHFNKGGKLTVGVDFPAGIFYWSGESNSDAPFSITQSQITTTSTDCITVTNTTLFLSHLSLSNNSSNCLLNSSGTSIVRIDNCLFITQTGNNINWTGNGNLILRHCNFFTQSPNSGFWLNYNNSPFVSIGAIFLDNCVFQTNGNCLGIRVVDQNLLISNCNISNTSNGINKATIDMIQNTGLTQLKIRNSVIEHLGNPGNIIDAFCALRTSGTSASSANYLIENSTLYAPNGQAIIRVSPTEPNIRNCVLHGSGTGSLVSSTTITPITSVAWIGANVTNCVFRSPIVPVTTTFNPGVILLGNNIQI